MAFRSSTVTFVHSNLAFHSVMRVCARARSGTTSDMRRRYRPLRLDWDDPNPLPSPPSSGNNYKYPGRHQLLGQANTPTKDQPTLSPSMGHTSSFPKLQYLIQGAPRMALPDRPVSKDCRACKDPSATPAAHWLLNNLFPRPAFLWYG